MRDTRLHPYCEDKKCLKCGSYSLTLPTWHRRGHDWFINAWPWFLHACVAFKLDHLHYKCHACGYDWAMACMDVREDATWR